MKRNILFWLFVFAASVMSAADKDTLKVSILGDSYSTYQGYVVPDTNYCWYNRPGSPKYKKDNDVEKVEQTWWYQVIEQLNAGMKNSKKYVAAKLERNNSFSGSTICYSGYKRNTPVYADYSDRSFVTRDNYLGEPDLILICGATNDSWAGSPIGEYIYGNWTHEQLFSFRPAMAKMLADIKQNYPTARILFMLNSELSEAINSSVHTICRHYGVQCLDLKDIDKQKGHPSVKGMKAIADQVVEVL